MEEKKNEHTDRTGITDDTNYEPIYREIRFNRDKLIGICENNPK